MGSNQLDVSRGNNVWSASCGKYVNSCPTMDFDSDVSSVSCINVSHMSYIMIQPVGLS